MAIPLVHGLFSPTPILPCITYLNIGFLVEELLMVEDDLYGNQHRYELFLERLKNITKKPQRGIYYCKNPVNAKYLIADLTLLLTSTPEVPGKTILNKWMKKFYK